MTISFLPIINNIFSCIIELDKSSSKILNKSGKSGHHFYIPSFRKGAIDILLLSVIPLSFL